MTFAGFVSLTLTEDGVDSRSQDLSVDSLDGLLLGVLGVSGVVGHVVALGLELGNALEQLGDGGGDVGQLDNVTLGSLGELAQGTQLVRDPLLGSHSVAEVCDQTASNGDVPLLNLSKMHFLIKGTIAASDRVKAF